MPWILTEDVEEYADHVWNLLAARPAENTVALHERGVWVPSVNGEEDVVDRFSSEWTAGTPTQASTTMRERLYALGELRAPNPAPPGRARLASREDGGVAVGWLRDFQAEVGAHRFDVSEMVTVRIDAGLLWLWEDGDGRVVSLAGRHRAAAGVARVGPVYTPPEHRRRGYGAAVTAACTASALEQGAELVVLFTDLGNPTSNAIYQQIGYQRLGDRKTVHFTEP